MNVYTAGHSTAALPDFIALLLEHEVDVVADVRSKPRSRLPHFDRVPLEAAVEAAGMSYRFLGDRLGGVPRDPAVARRWRQGHLDPMIIDHLRSTDDWTDGVAELERLVRRGVSVCLVCSEADPNECHRKAVALDLAAAAGDVAVVHLAVNKHVTSEVGVQEILF